MTLSRFELIAMIAMVLGYTMDGLDSSIINVAVPVIAESFGTDTNAIAWVTIIYFIMIAGLMLTFGRMADSGLLRRVYVIGFAIFTIGSVLCGLSDNLGFMIFARGVQGIGAAMLAAVAPMFCVKFLPPSKLGLGMAIFIVGWAASFSFGPAVGGIIMEIASWHWAFFINVPIGILGIFIALRWLPKDEPSGKTKLDLAGTTVLFVAVLCGILALELFSYPGYGVVCIALAAAMLILLYAFAVIEKKVKSPMLNLRMFKDWKFVSLSGCYLIVSLAFMGTFYILPFFLMKAAGLDTITTGLALMIPNIFCMILPIPVGRYCDLHGRRKIALICTISMVVLSFFYVIADPAYGWIGLMPAFVATGIMWGTAGPSVCSRIIDIAKNEDKGMASTMTNFVYYIGSGVGTALFASLLTFGAGTAGIPVEFMTVEEFMDGYVFAMWCAVAISLLAVLTAWIVNENKIKKA